MTDSDERTLEAKVVRYDVARLRLGQMLLPMAVLSAAAARRFPNVFTVLLTVGVQGATLALFLSAARRFGWQRIAFEHGGLSIGSTNQRIERHQVHAWTSGDASARLYGLRKSYKLRAREGAGARLASLLSHGFGPPLTLRRRGSFRARVIALAAAFCGAVGTGVAIGDGISWLAIAGPLALIFGAATFGALSQRAT